MKLCDQFIVTQLADEYVAVPMEKTSGFHGLVKLNESGAEVFRGLMEGQTESQLAERLKAKYPELDSETAKQAVSEVIASLKKAGVLEA